MAAKFKISLREFLSGSYYRLAAVSVGLSVLPLICALIAAEINVYRQKADFFMAMSDEVGSAVQAQQNRLAQSAMTVLDGLADNYAAGAEAGHYRELFNLTRSMYPNLRSVGLYERDGAPVAVSSQDSGPARNLRQLAENIQLGGIVSGETIITSVRDAHELIFIKPLRDNDGVIRHFITLSAGLDAYVRMIRTLKLPFAYSITMFNQESALILEDVEPGRQRPAAFEAGAPLPGELTRRGHGTDIIAGQDGRHYICTFFSQKINTFSRPYLTTLLMAPRDEVLRDAYRAAGTSLIWVIIAVLGTALALTAACSAAFKRPINRLLGISRRLGLGEFSARSELAAVGGAFRGYALALANMAEALEKDERALEAARLEAELASRSKSEFMANMSHELRTPMNAILGMTYLALKSDIGPAQRDYVHKIQDASHNLLRIINDILDFSKLEAGKMSMETLRFSIRDIFSSLLAGYGRQIEGHGIKMEIEVDAAVPVYLMGDPLRLEQILKQLTDSAVQRAKNGVVRVGCSLVGLAGNDCALRITVADTGKSIAPDTLHMLDSAFSANGPGFPQAERGLERILWPSIARKLISMMNGSISVVSEPGRGTVFTCAAHFGYDSSEQGRNTGALAGGRVLDEKLREGTD